MTDVRPTADGKSVFVDGLDCYVTEILGVPPDNRRRVLACISARRQSCRSPAREHRPAHAARELDPKTPTSARALVAYKSEDGWKVRKR